MNFKLARVKCLGRVDNPQILNSNFGESADYHYGMFTEKPIIGESFELMAISAEYGQRGISTSSVTEIKENDIFHTKNSIYKLEFIESLSK